MKRANWFMAGLALASSAWAQDDTAGKAADVVLHNRGMSEEDKRLVREVLVRVSGDDARFQDALRFCALAYLFEDRAKRTGGDLFAAIRAEKSSSDLWWVLGRMGEMYHSDSHLPSVRYSGAQDMRGETETDDAHYRASADARRLERWYETERSLGFRPDDAYANTLRGMDEQARRGWREVCFQLEGLGVDMLTGYSRREAERDMAAYLESRYAETRPDAKDVKGVTKCKSPAAFIGQRVLAAMLWDRAHMMKKVDAVIEAALRRLEELRGTGVQERHTELPTFAQMGLSGRMKDETGWLRYDRVPMEHGLDLSVVESKDRDVRKFRKAQPGTTDRYNGHGLKYDVQVVSDPRHDGLSGLSVPYLRPNTEYEVVLFPWYWSDSASAAYVVAGSSLTNLPAEGRVYVPRSSGGVVMLQFRARTDSQGRLKFLFVAEGRCAFTLGSLWLRPLR